MILQSLVQLYERLKDDPRYQVPQEDYSLQRVSYRVVLTPEGRLFAIQDARILEGGTLRARKLLVPGSTKPSGSGLNPGFLWDTTAYMLGFKADDDNPSRTARTFEAFRARHLELEGSIPSSEFAAVCRFLETWDPSQATLHLQPPEIGVSYGVFQIQGRPRYVHDDPAVRDWWRAEAGRGQLGAVGQCLVTGTVGPVSATHPRIKGVGGAQSAGAAIVSFNLSAFTSYAKEQSENAPVSESAAFRYTAAINSLLDGPMRPKHRLALGDATIAFWTDRPSLAEDVFARFAVGGSAALDDESQDESLRQKLEAFLLALRKGREAYSEIGDDPDNGYYLLALSPNAARLSVRFFLRGTLDQLLEHLRRHYSDIAITPQPASGKRQADPELPSLSVLLRQTARVADDIPPVLAAPLLRSVLTGADYPQALYAAVVRRIQADRIVNYPRACILKGYLNRNHSQEVQMSLDTTRPDAAYRMGRLFAVLEKAQYDALGSVGSSIRDRFYSAASATPGTVFPRLLRTYQHHLAKLEPGRRIATERLVQEILEPLSGFPPHLGLPDQGLFALGYYQQTRAIYTRHGTADISPGPDEPETASSATA